MLRSQLVNHSRIVVITGATAGVGRATARAFAREGCSIGLLARGKERLEITKSEIEKLGGRALALATDVADANQVNEAAAAVERELGPIDVWVNNAMTTIFAPFTEITPEEYKRATEVTYLGAVHGTMAALHRMLSRDKGVIVQVGSALAYRSIPLQAPYCGAKHAIAGFTDSIRCELIHRKSNVRLTMVQMPALNTPQFSWCRTRLPRHPQPVPPIFDPEVAADAIVWASHHRRREVYVGMPTVMAIVGNKIAPGFLDHYLAWNFESQETPDPVQPNRPDNLFEPAAGDHGAHGIFDARSSPSSVQFWANTHRTAIAIAALALGATACLTRRAKSKRS
jgi:NADP-dependent 3-hydroxy acid dehydrogenase YdfG